MWWWACRALVALLILVLLVTGADAQDGDARRRGASPRDAGGSARDRRFVPGGPRDASLGVRVAPAPGGDGVRVDQVLPGSPAEQSGIRPGDVLVSLDGTPLSHPALLLRMWTALPAGRPATFQVLRAGARLSLQVARSGPESAASLLQQVSGPTAYEPPTSPAEQVARINTLQAVVIDPEGRVRFLGRYDPRFATGPLPYGALLDEAMVRPDPAFSLDSDRDAGDDAAFRRVLDQEAPRIAGDPAYGLAWINRVMEQVWDGPGLEADRAAFAQQFERAFGITREEFEAFRSWRRTHEKPTPDGVRRFYRKFYAGGGLPQVGNVLAYMNLFGEHNEPEILIAMGREVGREAEIQALVDQINALPTGNARLGLALQLLSIPYAEILEDLQAPPAETQALLARFRAGQASEEEVNAFVGEQTNRFMTDVIGRKLVHGMVLSQDLLARLYRLPPARARLETFGAPYDSPTMSLFFRADYTLKGVCASGALEDIPSHPVFFFDERRGAGALAGRPPEVLATRFWLVPEEAAMRVSPDGTVIRFTDARVRLRSEVLDSAGADPAGLAFATETSDRYAAGLTHRYGDLAEQFPSLHALRECTKVIALARWARGGGLALRAASADPRGRALPRTVPGLWGATFLVSPGAEHNELQFWRTGGVSFELDEGTGWVQPTPDPAVSGDVLRQLAASTALSEKAAAAAAAGDLETARAMAEQSAQAMVGALPAVPEPAMVPAAGATAAGEVQVSEAALPAGDTILLAVGVAEAARRAAEPLAATSPEEYARTVEASRKSGEEARANLDKLQGYLDQYRQDPSRAPQVARDLVSLGASRPPTVGATGPGWVADDDASPPPAQVALGPSREELQEELQDLRADLDQVTRAQARLTRTILMDVAQYEDWQAEVERGYRRSWSNLQGLVENEVLFYAKQYLKMKDAPQRDLDAVQRLGEAMAARDVAEWSQERDKDWEWVGQGIVMLAGAAGLDDRLGRVLVAGSGLLDAGQDLTACYLAWRGMDRLKDNPAAFEAANRANLQRMRELVGRIKALEAKLAR